LPTRVRTARNCNGASVAQQGTPLGGRRNALGARGIGELPTIGVPAAVADAVYHATGRRIRDRPVTPDKLL
jgi:CO/xanthine dehydrogenase Mo-binding subunit